MSLVRIRLGESWKQNPAYRTPLRALAEGRARGFSPRDIVDVVGIEIDGIDLTEGLAEAALLDALSELLDAARILARPGATTSARFARRGVEIAFERTGEDIRLTIAEGPGRRRRAEVPAARFARAVRAAAAKFLRDLTEIHPELGGHRVCRDLQQRASASGRGEPARRPARPRWSTGLGPLTLVVGGDAETLEILDGQGAVQWRASDVGEGVEALTALLTADDAGAAGARVSGVVADHRLQTIRFARTRPITFSCLRTSLLGCLVFLEGESAPELLTTLASVRARLEQRLSLPSSSSLPAARATPSAPSISGPSLPAEGLRHLLFRRVWRTDALGPRPELFRLGRHLLVRTPGQAELRSGEGERLWRSAIFDARPVRAGSRNYVIGRDRAAHIVVLEPRRGSVLATVPAALEGSLRGAVGLAGGTIAAETGARVIGFRPDGGEAWAFDPGPRSRVRLATTGAALLVGTATGDVFGLDPLGHTQWRTATNLGAVDDISVGPHGISCCVTGVDGRGHPAVAAIRVADGLLLWVRRLRGPGTSPAVWLRDHWILGWEGPSGATLAGLDAITGAVSWETLLPGEGAAAPVVAGGRLQVSRLAGGLVAASWAGRVLFHKAAQDPDPALSPVSAKPALVAGGLIVLPAALIHVCDARTGRVVASLEPTELAPDSVAVIDGPTVVAAGRDGLLEAWRLRGHMSVVRPVVRQSALVDRGSL